MRATAYLPLLALLCAGCENEESPEIHRALEQQERALSKGVETVRGALQDPTFLGLSSGVQQVELACQQLALIEANGAASARQRLRSIVLSARAWDQVAESFAHVRPDAAYDTEELELFGELLGDKGLPAKVSAEAGYYRALDFACREGVLDKAVIDEILKGIERYSKEAPSLSAPCAL